MLTRIALIAAAVLVLATQSASAAQLRAFQFDRGSFSQQQPVEQQSPDFFSGPGTAPETWVNNPTSCLWDVDDHAAWNGGGKLAAGASASASLCVIADQYDNYGGDDHMLRADITSSAPDLTVTITSDRGYSATVPRTATSSGYRWHLCVVDHTPGTYPEVAGSNGGTGLATTYTVKVTSTARRGSSSPTALFEAPLVGAGTWMDEWKAGCA